MSTLRLWLRRFIILKGSATTHRESFVDFDAKRLERDSIDDLVSYLFCV